MVATISPADINYEETLSTLRHELLSVLFDAQQFSVHESNNTLVFKFSVHVSNNTLAFKCSVHVSKSTLVFKCSVYVSKCTLMFKCLSRAIVGCSV